MTPIPRPVAPMLAKAADAVPTEPGWVYEPKWDGFRAIVIRHSGELAIDSRNGQPLLRYFPELTDPLLEALPGDCMVDGEIVLAGEHGLDFGALQNRLHPAASRIAKLAGETPASVVLFDVLSVGDHDVREMALHERRGRLEDLVNGNGSVGLTPQSDDAVVASRWVHELEGAGLDGVVAKWTDSSYRCGERGWVKVKEHRTIDCVVGGFRRGTANRGVGSLLLGLYDIDGRLHHVGHTSSFNAQERREMLSLLEPLAGESGFGEMTGPGGVSRWSKGKELDWVGLTPSLVCEVSVDHVDGHRFRHAARFLHWRSDKPPKECFLEQIARPEAFDLAQILVR